MKTSPSSQAICLNYLAESGEFYDDYQKIIHVCAIAMPMKNRYCAAPFLKTILSTHKNDLIVYCHQSPIKIGVNCAL